MSANTEYTFEVRANNAGGTGSVARDRARTKKSNTAGTVTLNPSTPTACGSLTATLSDPDVPLSNDSWSMTHVYATEGGDSLGVEMSFEALVAEGLIELEEVEGLNGTNLYRRFTVAGWQADARLRVRVEYDDGLADDQTADTLSNQVKPDTPTAPRNLSATQVGQGYSEIKLTWDAPGSTCGRSIQRYEYQQQKGSGSWSSWTSVGKTTSYTASGLDSGSSYTFRVRAVNLVGEGPSASTSGATRASDDTEGEGGAAKAVASTAADTVLSVVARPNPFNPETTFRVHLPEGRPTQLTVYSLSGQVVRRLVEGHLDAGVYAYGWDGRNQQGRPVGSGVYLYRLRAGDKTLVGKVTLLR